MTPANRDKFLEHAKSVWPKEACGLVVIERGREVLIICKNIAHESSNQFEIDAQDFAKAELLGDVVAVVHSHPKTNPKPSEADLVACEATGVEWHIVSTLTGEWFSFKPSGYRAPLVGREYVHGLMDCYSIIRDYYFEVLSMNLMDFERSFDWWHNGQNLYLENFQKAGFFEVTDGTLKQHDVILMQILSPVTNHAAVYLGNGKILHHIVNRLSCREIYGGMWAKCTTKVVRHKNVENG